MTSTTPWTRHRPNQPSSVLASYDNTLDPPGNRLSVTKADGSSIVWSYDDAYRLIGETRLDPGGSPTDETTFAYDPVGNRLSMTVDGATTSYTFNGLDQLLTAGGTSSTYDVRGNLTQVSEGADVTTYAWDARDRLMGVSLPAGSPIAYTYDADGRRVRQVVGGAETNYLWDENSLYGDVVLETDAGGATLANYVLGGPELLAQTRSGSTSYYLTDALGSARSLTNSAGAVTDTYDYTAFGELFASSGTTANAYLYTGQQFDAPTGLYSLRARYYDPSSGRFLSRDPMEVQVFNPLEINRYGYAAGNPVNLTDPSGSQGFQQYGMTSSLVSLSAGGTLVDLAVLAGGTYLAMYALLMIAQVAPLPNLAPSPTLPEPPSPGGGDPLEEIRDLIDELNRRGETFRRITRVGIAILTTTLTRLLPGEPRPEPRPRDDARTCDQEAFRAWWNGLPQFGVPQPGVEWYEYEQRVARGLGTLGGVASRTVPAGTESINADGASAMGCLLLDAKHSPDPLVSQYREGAPPWIVAQLTYEIRRYRLATAIPNGVPGAQPAGLTLMSNLEVSRPFFERLLREGGFVIGSTLLCLYSPRRSRWSISSSRTGRRIGRNPRASLRSHLMNMNSCLWNGGPVLRSIGRRLIRLMYSDGRLLKGIGLPLLAGFRRIYRQFRSNPPTVWLWLVS